MHGAPWKTAGSHRRWRALKRWWLAERGRDRIRALSYAALPLVALAILVERAFFVLLVHQPRWTIESDMAGYVDRAWRLANPDVSLNRFDTFFPPGTHLLMTPMFWLLGDRDAGLWGNQVLWWLLATGTLWGVGLLGLRLFRHPLPALMAMLMLWGYWPFINYAGWFLSENPFSFFMVATLLLWWRARDCRRPTTRLWLHVVCGVVAGMTITIRPQFVLTMAALGCFWLLPRPPFVRVRDALPCTVAMLIAPLLAMALNSHAAGERVGLATNGGFNFFQGHCDVDVIETRSNHGVYIWASPARVQRLRSEGRKERRTVIEGHMAWEDAYFMQRGMDCIRADGISHLRRVATNIADFFWAVNPWPASTADRFGVLAFFNDLYCAGLFLCVAIALTRLRFPAERWLLLMLMTMMPVAILFYGDSRFRAPYDLFGILLCAGLLAAALGRRGDGGGRHGGH